MTMSGLTKHCPRCNTLIAEDSMFCGNCGLQLAAVPTQEGAAPYSMTDFSPTSPGRQGTAPGWMQNQPDFPPTGPTYPPGQPEFAPPTQPVYPAAPIPVARARRSKIWLIVALVAIVALAGGGTALGFSVLHHSAANTSSSNPSAPAFDRHGLPDNIPLPNGVTFNQKLSLEQTAPSIQIKVNTDEWFWTVASPDTPDQVQQFYMNNLPGKGWANPQARTGSSGEKDVVVCQSLQILTVSAGTTLKETDAQGHTIMINAPPGGSVLGLALLKTNNQLVTTLFCGGNPQTLPTP